MSRYRVRGPAGAVALIVVPGPGWDQRTFDQRVAAGELTVLETVDGDPPAPKVEAKPEPRALTVDDVLSMVGDDPDRARAALEAEQSAEKPRVTLVKALEEIAGEG